MALAKALVKPDISVIIPNFNGENTIEHCLKAVFAGDHDSFEVIVVDDGSNDRSIDIIKRFPCRLIVLKEHSGASAARNAGAVNSRGDILFFTDADCVLAKETLREAHDTFLANGPETILGGTYKPQSFDNRFFSRFQSVFINYSETKDINSPDYLATHALVIQKDVFIASGGFKERWLPILEDVEYSHRLRDLGYRLKINPRILVSHIFDYSFKKSVNNAMRKASYWTLYSIGNKDLLTDSGTASYELKVNVVLFHLALLCLALIVLNTSVFFIAFSIVVTINILFNKNLLGAFYNAYGTRFSLAAAFYYFCVYPIPVTLGGLMGTIKHLRTPTIQWGTEH